jgi:flagellar protein FliL
MKLAGLLVPVVALAVGLGIGAGGAILTKPAPPAEETSEGAEGAEGKETTASRPAPPPPPDEVTEFAPIGNQFVVPVLREGRVHALVLVSITLEVAEGSTGDVFSIEPRLRDAFLQVLFDHANAGGFDDRFTQADRMSLLRQALREAAGGMVGPVLRNVLIVDIVRQEA